MVTSQINGDYECKNDRIKRYLEEVKYRINSHEVEFIQIPREENGWADQLAKPASVEFVVVPEQVLSFVPLLLISFRSGRNGWKISYRYANWNGTPLCSTSDKISAYSGVFRAFWFISVKSG